MRCRASRVKRYLASFGVGDDGLFLSIAANLSATAVTFGSPTSFSWKPWTARFTVSTSSGSISVKSRMPSLAGISARYEPMAPTPTIYTGARK